MPITVKGIEEIKAKLDRLSDERTKIAIQRAGIRAAAKVLLAAQQDAAPFDTGKLEESIGMQIKKDKGAGKLVGIVGPDKSLNFIGRFHEFGTKFMTGTHWMQKSFDASAQEALSAYTTKVENLFAKHEYDDLIAALEASFSSQGDEG